MPLVAMNHAFHSIVSAWLGLMWSHAYLRKAQFVSAELFISPIISFMWEYKHIIILPTFWFTYVRVFPGVHGRTHLVLLGRAEMSLKSIMWHSSIDYVTVHSCCVIAGQLNVDTSVLSPYSCGGDWLSTSSPIRGWGGRRVGKCMCWGCPWTWTFSWAIMIFHSHTEIDSCWLNDNDFVCVNVKCYCY